MGVTKMKSIVLLVLALGTIATATPFRGVVGLRGPPDTKCEGPECPGGCCPEENYICCDNGLFCAATPEDCPWKKNEIKQDCPGTECPGGCCPNVGWFCCPGDEYCAASEEYCKKTNIAEKMISMAAPKKIIKQDCPGTECPGGCCPNVGWFCCPGDEYCAASEEYCKKADFAKILMSMAAPKKI